MKANAGKKSHVHAELIKAWADGAEIQVWITNFSAWRDLINPNWDVDCKYRIKPPTMRYRNFLWTPFMNKNRQVVCVCSEQENVNESRESWEGFIKWLGDWQEVEV